MRNGFRVVLFAAILAGCAAGPQEYRNDKEQPMPAGQRAFGESFTWEWRGKDPAAPAPAKPATPARAGASGQGDLDREFEDWRAWQEWKRRNPK